MRIQAQIIANSILQRVPAVVVKIRNKRYIFNIPQLHNRFMRNNFLTYSHQMNVFFTEHSAQTMGGFVTFIHELMGQNRSFGTHLFLDKPAFDYMEHLSYCMTYKTLPLSYYQFNAAGEHDRKLRYRIGLNSEQQMNQLIRSSEYSLLSSVIPNSMLLQEIKKLKTDTKINNCMEKIYNNSNNIIKQSATAASTSLNIDGQISNYPGEYFMDSECQIRYFSIPNTADANSNAINSRKRMYNYIIRPKRIQGSPNRQAARQLDISTKQLEALYALKKINKTYNINGKQQTRTIYLDQVKLPDSNGPTLIILHYKSAQNIRQVLNNPILQHHIDEVRAGRETTSSVIHIIDIPQADSIEDLLFCQQLLQLMRLFGKETTQVVYQQNMATQSFRSHPSFYPQIKMSKVVNSAWQDLMPNIDKHYSSNLWHEHANVSKIISSNKQHSIQAIAARMLQQYRDSGVNLHLYNKKYQLLLTPFRSHGYAENKSNIPPDKSMSFKINNRPTNDTSTSPWRKWEYSYDFDPEITFLGTSSMCSTYNRNVSGILMRMAGQQNQTNILFDCGEGIYNQIVNHFGPQKYQQILKNIKIIFITHLHSDHCTGILSLIEERNNILKGQRHRQGETGFADSDKLFLVIPSNTVTWFHSYNQSIQRIVQGCEVIFTQSLQSEQNGHAKEVNKEKLTAHEKKLSSFLEYAKCKAKGKPEAKPFFAKSTPQKKETPLNKEQTGRKQSSKLAELQRNDWSEDPNHWQIYNLYLAIQKPSFEKFKNLLKELKLTRFEAIPVLHCPLSFGVVVEHESKVKISYSGDCKPSPAFIEASSQSTLLIHEATFTDKYRREAEVCSHSTDKQAIEIGYGNKSQMTALTHFSKSLEIARMNNNYQIYFAKPDMRDYTTYRSFMACDHINFRLSQMNNLPLRCKEISRNIALNSHRSASDLN